MPAQVGRRWKDDILAAMPTAGEGGTYAESYGRAISFFLSLHHADGKAEDLETAKELARDALERLREGAWIKGHPAKPYYSASDGVGFLLYALLELDAYPAKLPPNL